MINFIRQYGPLVITLAATIGAAVFTPAFIEAHPLAFAVVGGIAQLLHAALPSVFNNMPAGGRA